MTRQPVLDYDQSLYVKSFSWQLMHALVIAGQWVTGIGTTLDDTVDSIALDPSTNIYAVGTTYATASTDLFYVSCL